MNAMSTDECLAPSPLHNNKKGVQLSGLQLSLSVKRDNHDNAPEPEHDDSVKVKLSANADIDADAGVPASKSSSSSSSSSYFFCRARVVVIAVMVMLVVIISVSVGVTLHQNMNANSSSSASSSSSLTTTTTPLLYVYLYNTFYTTAMGAVNIHYNNGAGWTTVPGVPMTIGSPVSSSQTGWYWFTIACSSSNVVVSFDFNSGGNNWMNNANNNYQVTMTTTNQAVQVVATSLTAGALSSAVLPTSAPTSTPAPTTAKPTTTTTAPPTTTTAAATTTKTITTPQLHVYLQNNFYSLSAGNVNIHYNNGAGWTTSPGVAMSVGSPSYVGVGSGSGWYSYTISCPPASSLPLSVSFVFNNGGNNWMNNGNNNYVVNVVSAQQYVQVVATSLTNGILSAYTSSSTGISTFTPVLSPLTSIRNTISPNTPTVNMPQGGWYVTPIHVTLLNSGDLLFTGWARASPQDCVKPAGSRLFSSTWVTSVSALSNSPGGVQNIVPINEQALTTADTMYCSSQIMLPDGRVLYVGGATYQNLGLSNEIELGLNYLRIYDPASNTISVVSGRLPSTVWYPTAILLDSGSVLIYGGFTQYCVNAVVNCPNRAIYKWSPSSPSVVTVLVSASSGSSDGTPSEKDYSHVWLLLPQRTVVPGGASYDVALVGNAGEIDYFSTTTGTFAQVTHRPNARPGYDTTAALTTDGSITITGGGDTSMMDVYNLSTSSWSSIDTLQTRDNGCAVLLTSGEVLLVNGDSTYANVNNGANTAVKVNVQTATVTNVFTEGDVNRRGYHNFCLLTKTGNLVLGGGCWSNGDIGCERFSYRLVTLYNDAERPVVSGLVEPLSLIVSVSANAGGTFSFTTGFTFTVDRPVTSVVMMTVGSFTHGFAPNQRRVQLVYTQTGNTVNVAASYQPMVQGNYILFAMSQLNVPSNGLHVVITH